MISLLRRTELPVGDFSFTAQRSLRTGAALCRIADAGVLSRRSGEATKLEMVRPERFELPTTRFEAEYSIQLSYGRAEKPSNQRRGHSLVTPPPVRILPSS